MKVFECYKKITEMFNEKNITEAQAQARELACYFAGIAYGDIFLKPDTPVNDGWEQAAEERINGKPIAYIINNRNFYGYDFYVDENVLIPRFDTECVVEKAINIIKEKKYTKVLDMCCGSGCIGITINKETGAEVVCSDISKKAVEITQKNAKTNMCKDLVVVQSDLFINISGKFDMIVSNPPYVTTEEYDVLEDHVKNYEPKSALLGGTEFYKKIARQAKEFLSKDASIVFEIGAFQKTEVSDILKEEGYNNIICGKDLSGKDRVIICTIN